MSERKSLPKILAGGLVAGLVGGLLFGLAMRELGTLPSVASLINADSESIGFAVHIIIAALLGLIFAWFIWHQRSGAGETLYWGLAYGGFWWFVGPLTLMPLILMGHLNWSLDWAQSQMPSLVGHFIYGIGLAVSMVWVTSNERDATSHFTVGVLVRAVLAGLFGGLVVISLMPHHNFPVPMALGVTMLTAILYALFDPKLEDGSGAGLVRGMLFGFFAWVAGEVTLMPIFLGEGLQWSLTAIQAAAIDFLAYLIFGAAMGWAYYIMSALAHHLFSDEAHTHYEQGLGTRGLQVLFWGTTAGGFGGLLFTLLMLHTGALQTIAQLVGSGTEAWGLVVHLAISILIGLSYGVMFRGRAYDMGSAVGWGISYGFFWWIFGALTLMPLLLGSSPTWEIENLIALWPSLIGHICFGVGVGVVFYLFEARQNPWWVPRSDLEAERIEFRKEQVLTSAPAMWALLLVIALLLPLLLVP